MSDLNNVIDAAVSMTPRDYFAAKAMQALLGGEYAGPNGLHEGWERSLAHEAFRVADAMLSARRFGTHLTPR